MASQSRRWRSASLLALAILFLVASPPEAHAQGNSFASPIGGRSALMGNTGTALAVDGSAPFLNPAAIVRMDDHRFAFSVNFYQYSITGFSNWHEPGTVDGTKFGRLSLGDTSISSSGFNVLPSTLCVFVTLFDGAPEEDDAALHKGRQKLSLCLGSLESQGVSFTALPFSGPTSLGQTVQAQSLVQGWSRVYAGPSYSVSVAKHVALGLSVHAVYTNDSFALSSSAISSSASGGGIQSSFGAAGAGGSLDVAPTLGAIYRKGMYTAGLSFAIPAVHLYGSYTGTLNNEYSSGTTNSATISTGSGSFSSAPPIRVAVGGGLETGRWTVEADAAVVIPAVSGFTASAIGNTTSLSGTTLTTTPLQSNFSVAEHVVVNPGLGAEYFVYPSLSLVAGASLNMTLQQALAAPAGVGTLVEDRQSLATASFGLGSYNPSGNVLLGVQVGYGWGQSLAANPYVTPNQWAIVDTTSYSALLILAGSTSLRSLGHAVEHIEKVIVGPPKPLQAPDAVATPAEAPDAASAVRSKP
jgi:hypothetical protein